MAYREDNDGLMIVCSSGEVFMSYDSTYTGSLRYITSMFIFYDIVLIVYIHLK